MIRYEGFDGFFIMKKDPDGKWAYLSKYHKRGDTVSLEFSDNVVRYFSDNTIKDGLAWKVFDMIRKQYPNDKLVLYVSIDKRIERVKFFNPQGEDKITVWHPQSDYYCFMPRKEFR